MQIQAIVYMTKNVPSDILYSTYCIMIFVLHFILFRNLTCDKMQGDRNFHEVKVHSYF